MNGDRYILEALEGFPKVELEDIRHYFGARFPSGVRKHEFVDRLSAYIIQRPSEWLSRMLERDLKLLKRLVDAGPEVPLYLDYPDYPTVLETIHLLKSDTSDANFREVRVPREIYDIVVDHIDSAIEKGEADGSFETERAALGYMNLYGVMTADDFYDRMLDYWEYSRRHDIQTFTKLLYDSPVMRLCRTGIQGVQYVISPNIFESEDILDGMKEFEMVKNPYPFSPEEALEAGTGAPYFVYGLRSKEGEKLAAMLSSLGYSGEDLVREEHDIWMNAQMVGNDDSTEAIFAAVTRRQDEIETFEEYNEAMEIVAAYANSLPKWLLKGYSANQMNYLKVILQSDSDGSSTSLDALIKKDPLLGLFIIPAPPDAPCPCGSGLSYRFCHGKRPN